MPSDLLFEIGTEEIPASFIEPGLDDLRLLFIDGASAARLGHGEVLVFGTPRRLALLVRSVAERTQDITREVTGPSVKVAFDPAGKPTRAAERFAEGLKLNVDQIIRIQTAKGEYVAARVAEKGQSAAEVLQGVLHTAVHGMKFKKSMRWGDVELSFARPVHWIVALLDEEVVPIVFGDVRSGRATYGHRFLTTGPIELRTSADYEVSLERAHVPRPRRWLLVARSLRISRCWIKSPT